MNDFIVMLLTNLAGYLGNNIYLEAGFCLFFLFALIFVFNLPKFLTIPLSLIGVIIILGFTFSISFIVLFVLGIALGYFIWNISRGA